jgi:nucleotide-binding universal stress UspA family protein
MLKPTKILVPTDFSEYSDRALKQALDIAKEYGAEVYVLHVAHEESYFLSDFNEAPVREAIQKQLDKFPQSKVVKVIADVRRGLHYEAILEEAEKKNIDLIVIASLGQSGIAKYLIGSVARNVLKGAKCPVLLTK